MQWEVLNNMCGMNEWSITMSIVSSRHKKRAITSQALCCDKVLVPYKNIQVTLPPTCFLIINPFLGTSAWPPKSSTNSPT